MREIRLASVARAQWVILAVLTIGSISFCDLRITLGVVIGGIICILNLKVMRMIFEGGLTSRKKRGVVFVKYAIKTFAMLAVVGVVVLLLQQLVEPFAFLVGLLTIFIAIAVEGLRGYLE